MFLKVRKLVPAHRSRLLRFAATLRERTARDPTLQDPLGLVERKLGTEAEGGCKEGSTSAAGAGRERKCGDPYHQFLRKGLGSPTQGRLDFRRIHFHTDSQEVRPQSKDRTENNLSISVRVDQIPEKSKTEMMLLKLSQPPTTGVLALDMYSIGAQLVKLLALQVQNLSSVPSTHRKGSGLATRSYNPITEELEAGGLLGLPGQLPSLVSKLQANIRLSKNKVAGRPAGRMVL